MTLERNRWGRKLERTVVGGFVAALIVCSAPRTLIGQDAARGTSPGADTTLSESEYLKRLTTEPDNPDHYLGLARLLAARGETQRVATLLLPTAERWLGRGQYSAAVRVLELAVEVDATAGASWALLGRARVLNRQHRAAEPALRRAVELGISDLRTLLVLSATLWENGALEEAERLLVETRRTHGSSFLIDHHLGSLYLWQGRFAEAVVELDRVVSGRSDWIGARLDLARALEGAGESAAARRQFEIYLQSVPNDAGARYGLASALLAIGERELAAEQMEIYGTIREREREDLRAEGRLDAALDEAVFLMNEDRIEEAVERLEELPRNVRVLTVLSQALQRRGELEAAIRALSEALALDPSRLDLRVRLEDLRAGSGHAMKRTLRGLVWGVLLAAAPGAWAGEPAAECGGARLREVSAELGIAFVHDRGVTGLKHLPETMGAGLAWLDYDGDGWWDLYLVQSGPFPAGPADGPTNRLLRNVDGRHFVDVTTSALAGDTGYGQGATAVDLDGNGGTDLVITNFGPDVLLWNQGDGSFRRDGEMLNRQLSNWSSSAAAADSDRDGDLDLYVSRYIDYDAVDPPFCGDPETGERRYCDPSIFAGLVDRFFLNQGNRTFVESASAVGFESATGRGLGLAFTDLDGDLLPDLYVANDLDPNHLFRNRGDGTFEDLSLLSGGAVNRSGKPEAGMGVAVADLDGDRLPDLFVTNFDVETNTHYRNMGDLSFSDVSARSGYGPPSFNMLAFGLGIADFDGDGVLDVFLGNGHIFEKPRRDNTEFRQPDQLLLGDGTGSLREVSCALLSGRRTVTRGVALVDYDNDGDVDIGLQENGGPAALLRSEEQARRWVGVRLLSQSGNREGVGARVELATDRRTLVRWVQAGDSYQSSSDRRALFSLTPEEEATALDVVWPLGGRQRLLSPQVNRYLTVRQGQAAAPPSR